MRFSLNEELSVPTILLIKHFASRGRCKRLSSCDQPDIKICPSQNIGSIWVDEKSNNVSPSLLAHSLAILSTKSMLLSRKMSFCLVTHHWYYSLDTRLNYTCE